MYLIIFGAGASYGSDTSDVPVCGNKLIDALKHFAPNAWGALPQEYLQAFDLDFEQGMRQLADQQPFWLPPLQRAMAAYFFQFLPKNSNLYLKLARRIRESNWNMTGSLVTFNYERLLQISLNASGIQPAVGKLPRNDQIELCLPHGCCNLFCDSVRGASAYVSFNATAVRTNGSVRVISNPYEFNERIETDAFPPVMSYFIPQKETTSGNSFVTNQRNRYRELVLNSSKIVIIGLKVREHDTHIWQPLAETAADLAYCSSSQSSDEFLGWARNTRTAKKSKAFDGYFGECFEDICVELEL